MSAESREALLAVFLLGALTGAAVSGVSVLLILRSVV